MIQVVRVEQPKNPTIDKKHKKSSNLASFFDENSFEKYIGIRSTSSILVRLSIFYLAFPTGKLILNYAVHYSTKFLLLERTVEDSSSKLNWRNVKCISYVGMMLQL